MNVMGSAVLMFDVIYDGKTLTVPQQSITAAPITLAQALKLHSLQEGSSIPKLGYAKDNKGAIYGVVDVENHIVYTTILSPNQMGSSQVKEVSYLSPSAPVLKTSSQALVKDDDAASLFAEARTAPLYASAVRVSKLDVGTTTPNDAEAAVEKVSIWSTVDKDNPQAVEAQEQLRKFYSEYQVEWRKVIVIAKVNERLFVNHEDALMLSDYLDRNTEIERKMRSLVAMGFSL